MPRAGPSHLTGAQTIRKRAPGRRVTSKTAFTGKGISLGGEIAEDASRPGFRKQAVSKRAREERALAAERRVLGLHPLAESESNPSLIRTSSSEFKRDSEETQQIKRDSDQNSNDMRMESSSKSSRYSTTGDVEPRDPASDPSQLSSGPSYSTQSRSNFLSSNTRDTREAKRKKSNPSSTLYPEATFRLGKLAQMEITLRKRESLGMAHTQSPKKLGSGPPVK